MLLSHNRTLNKQVEKNKEMAQTSETHFLDKSFSYTWKIHEFHKSPFYDDERMFDEIFFFEGSRYRLFIEKTGDDPSPGMNVKLRSEFKSDVLRIFYFICVTTKNGKNIVQEGKIVSKEGCTDNILYIDSDNVKSDIIINDCVTINCKLTARRRQSIQPFIPQKEVSEDAGLEDLSTDLGSLYSNKLQADARIRVNYKNIDVHSQILSARSPVFAAMFQSGMAECNSRVIEVEDVGEDAMKYLLQYIYTGLFELKDLPASTVADVFVAAEKYDVRGLKTRCSRHMMTTLSEENLQCYLEVALMHDDKKLVDFFTNVVVNRTDIIETEAWKKLIDKIPNFGFMVLNAMAKAMK